MAEQQIINNNNNNKSNILFFIPSPRHIPEVKQPIIDLLYGKHDVIWMKYFKELDAYRKAREFFLLIPEKYDYFCIIPDDLVINQKSINILLDELVNPTINLKEFGGKYPVLAGICNLSYSNDEEMSKIAAAKRVIPDENNNQKRIEVVWDHFIKFKELESITDKIIQCLWIGFSCQFIHRSVLEKIQFRQPDHTGGLDTFFSYDLRDLQIPQYIHKQARFLHLKGLSSQFRDVLSCSPDVIYTGVYDPHIIYVDKEFNNHLVSK